MIAFDLPAYIIYHSQTFSTPAKRPTSLCCAAGHGCERSGMIETSQAFWSSDVDTLFGELRTSPQGLPSMKTMFTHKERPIAMP
jgi:hypothetical protein